MRWSKSRLLPVLLVAGASSAVVLLCDAPDGTRSEVSEGASNAVASAAAQPCAALAENASPGLRICQFVSKGPLCLSLSLGEQTGW